MSGWWEGYYHPEPDPRTEWNGKQMLAWRIYGDSPCETTCIRSAGRFKVFVYRQWSAYENYIRHYWVGDTETRQVYYMGEAPVRHPGLLEQIIKDLEDPWYRAAMVRSRPRLRVIESVS